MTDRPLRMVGVDALRDLMVRLLVGADTGKALIPWHWQEAGQVGAKGHIYIAIDPAAFAVRDRSLESGRIALLEATWQGTAELARTLGVEMPA